MLASSSETRAFLNGILKNYSNPRGQLAVVRAIATDAAPDPSTVDDLATILNTSSRERAEAAAQALTAIAGRGSDAAWQKLSAAINQGNLPAAARVAATRALGKLVDKRAAQVLIDLLRNENGDASLQRAATDALVEMTGFRERDAGLLLQWWQQNGSFARVAPADWTGQMRARQAEASMADHSRYSDLKTSTRKLIEEQYAANPDPRTLKRLMDDPSEDFRVIGVELVGQELSQHRVSSETISGVRALARDSSADVREAAARTLALTKLDEDPETLAALLAQLQQETDIDAKVAIIYALGKSRSLQAVEPLIASLENKSSRVSQEAAGALRNLGESVRQGNNPQLAARLKQQLLSRFDQAPAMSPLRDRVVEALAGLGDPGLLELFHRLMSADRSESPAVRSAAIQGVFTINNAASANQVMGRLQGDPDPGVRLKAAIGLRELGSPALIEGLARRLNGGEPDASVRDEIWKTAIKLANAGSINDLGRLAALVADNPDRAAAVLDTLVRKLEDAVTADPKNAALQSQLASTRVDLADVLARTAAPDFKLVSANYRRALDYFLSINSLTSADPLIMPTMNALLRSEQFEQAGDFATAMLKARRQWTGAIVSSVDVETTRLERLREFKKAIELIDKVRNKVDLGPSAGMLDQIRQRLEKEQTNGGLFWLPEFADTDPSRCPQWVRSIT